MLIADTCEASQFTVGCSPTFEQFNAEVTKAVGDIFGAFFHGGPQMVLGGLLVLWALGRILAWATVFFLGRTKKGEQ
ncbi:MAG: hypothetical protein JWP02_1820 [Acidimicrobiales bacterium]|nr:hypothetical protein [Acidimicrobiales bacterium]